MSVGAMSQLCQERQNQDPRRQLPGRISRTVHESPVIALSIGKLLSLHSVRNSSSTKRVIEHSLIAGAIARKSLNGRS